MNNIEINLIQNLGNTELHGFECRFITALNKQNSKYELSLWHKGILRTIAIGHGFEYNPNGVDLPNMTIHYVSFMNQMPKDAIGIQFNGDYDIELVEIRAKEFAKQSGITDIPQECWILRDQVFFSKSRTSRLPIDK